MLIISFIESKNSLSKLKAELKSSVPNYWLIRIGPNIRSAKNGVYHGTTQKHKMTYSGKLIRKVESYREETKSQLQQSLNYVSNMSFSTILYYGHSGGVRVGCWTGLSPHVSISEFVGCFVASNVRCNLFIAEGCHMGGTMALSELSAISNYLLGTTNYYHGEGLLQFGEKLGGLTRDFSIDNVNRLVSSYYALPRVPKYHSFILLNCKEINPLLNYISSNSILRNIDKGTGSRGSKYDKNLYILRTLDDKLGVFLDKIVLNLEINAKIGKLEELMIERYVYCSKNHKQDMLNTRLFSSLSDSDKDYSLNQKRAITCSEIFT